MKCSFLNKRKETTSIEIALNACRAVREALEVNMASCGNGATVPISKKEAEMLLGKLSKELGIASGGSKKTPPSPGTSLASATLRDVLNSTRKQERAARSNNRPGSAAVTAAASRGNVTNMNSMPHHRATNASHDRLSEQELCDILQDASLDDSTIEEAMRDGFFNCNFCHFVCWPRRSAARA